MRNDTVENAELKKSLKKFHETRGDQPVITVKKLKQQQQQQPQKEPAVLKDITYRKSLRDFRKLKTSTVDTLEKSNRKIDKISSLLQKLRAALDYDESNPLNVNNTHGNYGRLDAYGNIIKPPRTKNYHKKKKKLSRKKRAEEQKRTDETRSRPTSAAGKRIIVNNFFTNGEPEPSVASVLVTSEFGEILRKSANNRGVVGQLRPASATIRRSVRSKLFETLENNNTTDTRPSSAIVLRKTTKQHKKKKNILRPQSARRSR